MYILKGLLYMIAVCMMISAVLFVDFVYKTFSVRQRDVRTDAVVVLAGGKGRIEEGIKLYLSGKGRYLLLIGVDPSVRKRDLFRARPGERGDEDVYLENVSHNTFENALYARTIITGKKIHSITLITSRYHMKRSILIFRNILPRDVAIYPYPVDSRNLKEEWWSHSGSFRLLFSEFYKYVVFRFFFLFDWGEFGPLKAVSGEK
ncbi:MAG: YdcF family protein [Geobacter sp.]|nr:YdcF family protein [Geobacter sp.]